MEDQPVNNQVQQAPINPVPVSKNPNQWIIGGIILILLLIVSTIYVRSLPSRKPISPAPKPLVSSPSISPTPDPVADWKTYSLQSNFEVKYPQTWNFYKFKDNAIAFGPKELVQANRERLNDPNIGALVGGKAWPVEVKPLNGNLYFYNSNDVSFISDSRKKVSSEEIIIDGTKAVRYIIVFNYDAPYISKGDIIEVVVVEKDAKTYSITLSDQKYRDTYNQILSTFKFTDQTSAEGRACGGTVLEPCPTGYTCLTKTIKSRDVSETSGKCVKENQVVCAQDVKQCPDGSYVSRQPPSCEFTPCP